MIEHTIQGIHFTAGQWPLRAESPTVIFIHGVGNSSILWKAQVEGLAANMNAVAIDLPGHGESIGNGMDKITDYARAVAEFIDEIHAPSPIPCGLSMGGAITLQLLLDGSRRYKAGIIINSGVRLKVMPFVFDLIKSDYQGFANSMITSCISAKTDTSKLQELITESRKSNPGIVYNDLLACNRFDVADRLHEITVPSLVLTAEEDKLTPEKFGRYLAEHIADSQIFHVMEAGHMSPVEKPEEVTQAIREFVNKTAAGC
jgi:pimeloyl-ACP methyl ester carboxylesterase